MKKTLFILSLSSLMSFTSQAATQTQDIEKLYKNNCSLCHSAYTPSSYTTKQWDVITKRMFPKTKLSSQDSELILNYLKNNSKN